MRRTAITGGMLGAVVAQPVVSVPQIPGRPRLDQLTRCPSGASPPQHYRLGREQLEAELS